MPKVNIGEKTAPSANGGRKLNTSTSRRENYVFNLKLSQKNQLQMVQNIDGRLETTGETSRYRISNNFLRRSQISQNIKPKSDK